ncbi:MAG: hypothetical protein HZB92_04240 [Euryarchaeota archaeon]|nr:hypothetical protein [Euryarchaeota archaeon]
MNRLLRASPTAAIFSVGLIAALALSSGAADAWQATGGFTAPTKITAGGEYTFSFRLDNTGNSSMRIAYLGLRLDWSANEPYQEHPDVPKVLTGGGSFAFLWSVAIPANATAGQHLVRITIQAQDPGMISDWSENSTRSWDYYINVAAAPEPDGGGKWCLVSPDSILTYLVWAPLAAGLAVITHKSKRKK